MTKIDRINVNLFKALSDETRLRIVMLLSANEMCVCEICEITGLSQPMVSRHLGLLRSYNIVSNRRDEQWIYYAIKWEESLVSSILNVLIEHSSKNPIFKSDLDHYMTKSKEGRLCKQKT